MKKTEMFAIILIVTALAMASTARAAPPNNNFILELEGLGESTVLAWSWGASQSGSFHVGGGGGAGRANFQDLSVTKLSDDLSPLILESVALGRVHESAILTTDTMVFEMRDVLVTSISMGASSNDREQTENITLNFAAYCLRKNAAESCFNIADNLVP